MGGGTRPWLFGVKLEREKEGEYRFDPVLNIHTPLFPNPTQFFLFVPLKFSSRKKSKVRKI